jgi:hypothetical protein
MGIKNILTLIGTIVCSFAVAGFIFFMAFVFFPFLSSLAPEKRLEKFIDKKCLEGNEIAIRIRLQNIRYFGDRDCSLVRAAIKGNKHAIRALKLELTENSVER